MAVRSRWQEWVIVLSIFALGGVGVWTIWGPDLRRLVKPDEAAAPAEAPAAAPAAPPPPAKVPAPAGQAAGPF
jgi:hypothetical protein